MTAFNEQLTEQKIVEVVNELASLPNSGGLSGCQISDYQYTVYPWWPAYWPVACQDRTQQAFRVLKAMLDAKMLKLKTVEDFIAVVDKITAVL